ncbi:putative cyclin-dependent protein kinase inhibitor SMR2 [Abeliophyllum distichum]|uniref:Cyclin-dependent protein kinase inhibitor SMR2 n=1 Tax=Abeliophyllum distichum TaxID=126358 RepID=A0ABD1TEL6_9LAMI
MSKDQIILEQSPKQDVKEDYDPKAPLEINDEGSRTPTSQEHKISKIRSCPSAPRKKKAGFLHKRKFHNLEFFEIAGGDEMEVFFQSFPGSARVPPAGTTSKRRHINQ